ncbi:WbqC family protein [Campylobacter insulaenigrae]|uniref:WbqC family protein n=1 Tax=Campylobacter insulaenigrae NCTC 12927 TaxID=1031564 RepID=A0A0A8H2A2_9BACT|nr:WbqC family protein [Campylobacter insulaenigrae]AJC88231.1 WbqC family protein [Campylobacter insulaenigrae NCTC 12927]VEH95374.1 WbqC-like protein family [Campylobacter insulaenigrae]
MKIAIMQPTFNPWLGYIYMIASVDIFVFLDNVQFEKRSWQNRNKIKLNNQCHLISINLQQSPQKTPLNQIYINEDSRWKNKFLDTFYHAYSKSANFNIYFSFLKNQLNHCKKLVDFNISLIDFFCQNLNIKTPLLKASNLNIVDKKREDLLLEICKQLNADKYLSPEGSKDYLEKEYAKTIFQQANINVEYLDFIHPTYKQLGKDFLPYLGIFDFIVNEKKADTKFKEIIELNRKINESFV